MLRQSTGAAVASATLLVLFLSLFVGKLTLLVEQQTGASVRMIYMVSSVITINPVAVVVVTTFVVAIVSQRFEITAAVGCWEGGGVL